MNFTHVNMFYETMDLIFQDVTVLMKTVMFNKKANQWKSSKCTQNPKF